MYFDWYGFHGSKSIDEIKKQSLDCFSKIKLLGIHGSSEDAKKLHKELVYGLRKPKGAEDEIAAKYPELITDSLSILDNLNLRTPTIINLNSYPKYSFSLQFKFKLATSYLSKDDDQFYVCENPIRKEKVFKVPIVPGSSWKGNMRWSACKNIELKIENTDEKLLERIKLVKLFGNENKAEERHLDSMMPDKIQEFKTEIKGWTNKSGLRRGRLNFHSTFFNKIGLEVINPHDRKTKAGTLPVYIESVPDGAEGIFSLLYVPFDLMGKPRNVVQDEVISDLMLVCNAVRDMMSTYGFSAKRSSGFGIIQTALKEGICEMSGVPMKKTKEHKAPTVDQSSSFAKLGSLKLNVEVADNEFSDFEDLRKLIGKLCEEVAKDDK